MTTSNILPPSPNEKYIFKCDQHPENISKKLLEFYKDEHFFDTVLVAGKDCINIKAHKIVLSSLSDFFFKHFRSISTTTSNSIEVKLNEIEASTLKLIVDFIYSGSIELNIENIEKLLRSAVFLKMKNLTVGCCGFLEANLNTSNCLHWLSVAKELELVGLPEKTSNFIYTHFEEVSKQSEFLLLNKNELKDVLFNDNNHGHFEEQVFLSLVAWIEYEKLNRQNLLFELLSMIRYQFLTPKFIVDNSSSVSKTVECCELILGWLKYHLSPESRTIEQQNLIFVSDLEEKVSKLTAILVNDVNEVEIRSYDRTLKRWSIEKRSHPLLTKKHHYYNNTIMIDEKLYLVGGAEKQTKETASNVVECIDLKTDFKLTDLPPMRVARHKSQLANLNGHLCVFGGFMDSKCTNFIDSVEIFNFSTRKWKDLQPLFKPNIRSRIVGHNGILYIFDFRYGCVQCYDVSCNQWTKKDQPIDDSIRDFRIAGADNFLFFVSIGGDYFSQDKNYYYKRTVLKLFDLSDNTWCEVAELKDNKSSLSVLIVTVVGTQILFYLEKYGLVEYDLHTNEFNVLSLSGLDCTNFSILPIKK